MKNTDILFIASVITLVIVLSVLIIAYNFLIRRRNSCKESWSNIDTELKRRYDLILNILETVKGYAVHERGTLENVAKLRSLAVNSTGSPTSQAKDESELLKGLRTLFSVVEKYPDLKANENFLELQDELCNTKDRIQEARKVYNNNVADYNNLVQMFPSNIIAIIFSFIEEEFFNIENTDISVMFKDIGDKGR